ncbi:hypothetical protein BD769DRAFT_1674632 [Suillus cothurnatus]|nr:hypothetical protein BD769DRAFT_1674632 [Suillus cothurnatus]
MVYKANSGSGGQRVESLLLQTTGGDDENGGMRDSAQLVVDSDGSDERDDMKEQRRIRVVGEMKVHEDLDPKGDPSQLTCAPVTHKTAKDLTPAFLRDAKFEVSKPGFIRWFIATCPYQASACVTKKVSCGYPPVADGTQRNFKCTTCRNERGGLCSWLQDLLEVYIREAYQLDVGEARVLASSKENDPQDTLSSYYQTWLAEPAGRYSDDELRERLKALETTISLERPRKRKKDSRISFARHDLLQQEFLRHFSTELSLLEPQPKPLKRASTLPPPSPSPSPSPSPPTQGPSTPALVKISPGSQFPADRVTPPPSPPPPPAWSPSTPALVETSPGVSQFPVDRASLPPPQTRSPSTPAPIQISLGRSYLLPTTPDRLFAGNPPPLSASPSISSGLRQTSPPTTPNLVSSNFYPPTTAPTTITALEIYSNAPQGQNPVRVDNRHATSEQYPGDNLPNTIPNNFNAYTNEAFVGAVPRSPSCDLVRLKSDTATLSDGLARLIVEDLSSQAGFSNCQEAEMFLLKTLRGSLQACDILRSIGGQQDSRHAVVTRSLEDRICSLTLENGQLKQEVAAKCLEQKICLLEVENDQLQGRLLRQDQELEDKRLQGMTVKGLERKIRQLEVETDQLQEKINKQEQEIATMSARTQLADCVLRLASQQDLLAPGYTQADTNLRDLVSMIHAHLDSIQPTPAKKRLGGLGKGDGEMDSERIGQ